VSQYTAGKIKKSRREKEQEAAEAKKREEEANAAKAYAEFLDAFEGEDVGKKNPASSFVKASGEAGPAYAASRGQSERQTYASGAVNVLNRVCGLVSVQPQIFTIMISPRHLCLRHLNLKGNERWMHFLRR
jgi:hypothetical protein